MAARKTKKTPGKTPPPPPEPEDSEQNPEALDYSVTVGVLAHILGVSVTRIAQFVYHGMPKEGRNLYDVRKCVQWRIQDVENSRRQTQSSASAAFKESAKVKLDLEIAKLRGEVVPAQLLEQTLMKVSTLIASQLEGLGPRVANDLSAMTNPVEIQHRILEECRAIRSGIAAQVRDYSKILEAEKVYQEQNEDVE